MIIIMVKGWGIQRTSHSHVCHACNNCNGSTIVHIIIMNRKVQPDSNGLRIHVLHIMKTKTRLLAVVSHQMSD